MRYAKTTAGVLAMKDRSVVLTVKQRAALVICDAKRPLEQVLQNLAAVGSTTADLDYLKSRGLVAELPEPDEVDRQQAQRQFEAVPARQRYQAAYPIATRLASSLGLKGFTLTLALERSSNYEELCSVATRLQTMVPREQYTPLHHALYQ